MNAKTFRFGKNWQSFVESYFSQERVELAKTSLREFLDVDTLAGKTFADVGAGSGIVSLAALELGASEVVSIDVDEECLGCCTELRSRQGDPPHWQIARGSVLDDEIIGGLPQFDVVYSWGVLHHTGNMWKAIDNTMKLVKPGGLFYLAIYNKVDDVFGFYRDGRFGTSRMWEREKKLYVSLPSFAQNLIDHAATAGVSLLYLLTFRNPWREIREHKYYFNKGMPWRINIKDWLGGYPYEYATVAEVFAFAKERGFRLENLTCTNGLLNNEFLLRRTR